MPPVVSVIIPAYNRAHYIAEALESVFSQTFTDYEVIVVDDGSTDNTKEAIAPYIERIRYVYQENRGVAAARNRGIAMAQGKWIAFLDSDDKWESETLEKIISTSERYPGAGLISIMAREITPDSRRTARVYGKRSKGLYYSAKSLLRKDGGGCSWFAVRRAVIDRVGYYDEALRSAEECDLVLRISFETRMVAVREHLLLHRIHESNLSHDKRLNANQWVRILEKLSREHPEFLKEHPLTYRRALGKERLRLGRELLAQASVKLSSLREARTWLRRSIGAYPFFLRAYVYLLWSYVAPMQFGKWRSRELARKRRASTAQ